MAHVAKDDAERARKVNAVHQYYGRFDNIYRTAGSVTAGMIDPLPCETPIDELEKSLLVGSPQKIVDQLGVYADSGHRSHDLECQFWPEPAGHVGNHSAVC